MFLCLEIGIVLLPYVGRLQGAIDTRQLVKRNANQGYLDFVSAGFLGNHRISNSSAIF
jgi:hypothetical protein